MFQQNARKIFLSPQHGILQKSSFLWHTVPAHLAKKIKTDDILKYFQAHQIRWHRLKYLSKLVLGFLGISIKGSFLHEVCQPLKFYPVWNLYKLLHDRQGLEAFMEHCIFNCTWNTFAVLVRSFEGRVNPETRLQILQKENIPTHALREGEDSLAQCILCALLPQASR